jgi:hypothetical protein
MARLLALLSRAPRVLYALWLVVAMTRPAGAHACPVHDRALAAAMAAHGMAMHHASEHSAPGHHSTEQCHCLGDCLGMATPLPAARAMIPAPAAVLAEATLPASVEQSFDTPDRLLPPATAPPTALVA